jgi:glycosyltransferase involved in cell wall biosynthesis
MRVAVNTRVLLSDYPEDSGSFIFDVLRYLANNFPEHQFIFILPRRRDNRSRFSSNVTPVIIEPNTKHPLLLKYWYDVKLPGVLRKYKADVFVSFDGWCSLTTRVPQCLVIPYLNFLNYSVHFKKSSLLFSKRYIQKILQKAKSIATVSEFSKQDIINNYKIEKEKINVIYIAAGENFKPVPADISKETKNKYTDGMEYFLYKGTIHPEENLVNLLKAFSVFKKRQKSNFKLVLASRVALRHDSFIQSLKIYKLRDDVIVLGDLTEDELAKIMGSTYALVYPSLIEGFSIPVLEAMKCDIPVITSSHSGIQEIANDAALYADAKNFEDIAEKMMLIYKDENLRKDLIEKGKIIASLYSWKRTAEQIWQTILKAVD